MNPIRPAVLLVATALSGQEDPLAASPEFQAWARRASMHFPSTKQKLQGLLDAVFQPVSEGGMGLGMVYDNSRTRTVEEVWKERRANCLSLTAFFVAACKASGIEAKYAEPINTNRWKRSGNLVRLERHVVTLIPMPPLDDAVADFLPQLRRRMGSYLVTILSEARFRALFYSNRAVEMLDQGLKDQALAQAKLAVSTDPTSSMGWNTQGVVQQALGNGSESEACYRRAIALEPRDGTPVGNMEQLCRSQGRFEEALRFRILGSELRKKDPYYHAFLAEEAMEMGNWDEAQKEIKSALRIQQYEPEFHLTQAKIHIQRGHVESAVKSLQEARRWAVPEERGRFDTKLAAIRK